MLSGHSSLPAGEGVARPGVIATLGIGGGLISNDQDIGSPALAGSFAYSNGTYTIIAGGSDINGVSDQFNFAYNATPQDGSIIARVGSLVNTNVAAKAGLMFRSSTAASAAFAGIFVTPGAGLTFMVRAADGGTAGQTQSPGFVAPIYLKLTRGGNQVSAFRSSDGVIWTQFGATQTAALGSASLAGLAVTSRNVAATTTATFTNVSLLSPGWNDADIGSPNLPGGASFDPASNRFDLLGGGAAGIGGTSDQFNFSSRTMTGDGSVIARVDSLSNTDPSAAAGVMFRDTLASNAIFAAVFVTPSNALSFQWRSAAGASASSISGPVVSLPVWTKLSQHNGEFSAFYSADQLTWTQLGADQSIPMSSAATYAGIVVTSHSSSSLCAAEFTGFSLVQDGWSDTDIGAPPFTGSAIFDPPSNTYTLTGSGDDIFNTADEFNFLSHDMNGDGNVITYVNAIQNTDPWAKAGVMIRADLTASSMFAGVFVSPVNGIVFEWRPGTGAAVQQEVSVPATLAPVSLKLTRAGNSYSAYYCIDGSTWILVGPAQSVAMPSSTFAGLAVTSHNVAALCSASFTGTSIGTDSAPGSGVYSAADELFLDDLSRRAVRFFYDETNPATGLVPDGALANGGSNGSPSSIASLGFGLSALTIADRRGWLTHAEAYQRTLTTVNFLWNSAAQVNGFYYHFLNPSTGARSGSSELSSVDTVELMAGVLNVAQYWKGTAVETTAINIFNRVNWPWMQKPNGHFYGAWMPEGGGQFSGEYGDFSEAALLYLLPLGSTTHPTTYASWLSWSRSPLIHYGSYTFITAGTKALFTVQYPMGWFDLRGLADSTGLNYYSNAQTATLAQRQWMTDLSGTYPHLGPNTWGLTSSDSASGYATWGGPPAFGPVNGTVVPTGPGGSLAFTPRQSVDALKNMQTVYGAGVYKKYGFVDAFNPATSWTSSIVLGIDQGMMLLAAENSRSNFVWNTFNEHPVARQALATAFPSIKPSLLAASSRKTRPDSVNVDLPVAIIAPDTVEPRLGGPTKLILNFQANIVKGPGFAVTLSSGSVSSSTVSGSTLTLNLSGVIDAQTLDITISDLRHSAGSASGSYSFAIDVLLADANQDRSVDTIDFNLLAANFGGAGKDSSQGDFNFDALVDTVDFNLLASAFGHFVAGDSVRGGITSSPMPASAPAAVSRVFSAAPIRSSEDLLDVLN